MISSKPFSCRNLVFLKTKTRMNYNLYNCIQIADTKSRKHNEYQHVTEYFAVKNQHRTFCKGIESFNESVHLTNHFTAPESSPSLAFCIISSDFRNCEIVSSCYSNVEKVACYWKSYSILNN